jgi:hypothetical protein
LNQRISFCFRRAPITVFEDLSNDLVYEIFDYVGYILTFMGFSQLNKRFSTLVNDSPLPLSINVLREMSDDYKELWDFVIGPQRHRIRCLHLTDLTCTDKFFSIYFIDASFACLESITLGSITPIRFLSILPELQSLPCLYRLSVRMETVLVEPPDMTGIYQILLNLESLKYLKFSTPDYGISANDTFNIYELSILKQETSNLEYLIIQHPISVYDMLKITRYTHQLRHLFVESLEESSCLEDASCTISKLPQLTKLIINNCNFTVEDWSSLLNGFDCRLKTLKMQTDLPSSFLINQQWKQLIIAKISDLDIFKIHFIEQGSTGDEHDKKLHVQNAVNFVFDPFWYEQGWMAQIYVEGSSVWSLFRRSK